MIPYLNYWVPLIEAAALAKVIMVGDMVHLGRGLERTPLLVPTLYRTVLFSALVGVFNSSQRGAVSTPSPEPVSYWLRSAVPPYDIFWAKPL